VDTIWKEEGTEHEEHNLCLCRGMTLFTFVGRYDGIHKNSAGKCFNGDAVVFKISDSIFGFFLSKTGTILASINGQGMTLEIKGDLLVGCAALRLSENGKRKRGIIV
jgi:hypothetical protein